MNVVIREFQPDDLEGIENCFVELQEHERRVDTERLPGTHVTKSYCARLLDEVKENRGKFFVAEIEGIIVGFAAVWVEEYLEIGKEEVYVSDLVVLPPYRGRDIGRLLMECVEAFALDLGLSRVSLSVLVGNTSAYEFYKTIGYSNESFGMVKKL